MDAELLARNIAAHWVQAGVLAASALIAIRLLQLEEARARLAALHVTLAAILLLPLMQPWKTVEPAIEVTTSAVVGATSALAVNSQAPMRNSLDVTSWADPSFALVAFVIAGAGLRLLWLFHGVIRLGRFSRTATLVSTPQVAAEMEDTVGVSARYLQQDSGHGPWTFGVVRPAIALPAGFGALTHSFQRAVICHELLHIKRRDIAIAFLEELAVAALWFHPWVWLLRARIRVAREQAVDACVIALLGNREDYVRCLVDMSGHDLAPHFAQAGAGMLRPRELRARVDAIFQEVTMSRARFVIAASAFLAVTSAAVLVAAAGMPLYAQAGTGVAADAPRRQINTVYPEYPHDALERGIKGTVIVDITINPAGDVTTAAVESGPQELRASAFTAALKLKYTAGSSTTAMKIAFHYMLSDLSWGVRIDSALRNIGLRPLAPQAPGGSASMSEPDASGAYRIGGDMRPPKKIKDAAPVYPASAKEARVQGVVILEARIDEHGLVGDVRLLRSIPLLDGAAIEAVKQWQYEPTLLNGVAVPVITTVTVNFTLRE